MLKTWTERVTEVTAPGTMNNEGQRASYLHHHCTTDEFLLAFYSMLYSETVSVKNLLVASDRNPNQMN